jgi:archaellum component FlaG (FlaF/FlaG flagellin family)
MINSSKIPQSALGGNYTLGLFVKDNATAGLNNATAIGNLTIYETALHLGELGGTRCGPGSSYTISIGTIVKCRPKITNYGAKAASSVNVSLSGCPKLTKYAGPGNLVQLGDIGPGSSNYSDFWRFNATESGTCTLTINASAAGTAWDRQSFTVTFNISASTAAPGDELPEETLTKGLAITSYPAELQIEQGKSKTVNVKVKNTGNVTLGDVSLAVEEIEATWWRTAPSTTVLTANEEKSFAVTFSIPDNATVANYPIAYKAEATSISATKSASLVVLPGPVAQQEINISLANYTARYEALLAELNAAYAAGGNVTEAESKLALVKELLDRAEASIEAGDYFAANALLAQIKAALDDAEVAIAAIEMPEKELPWSWLWVGAAAAIIAIIAVYMLWRRPGYYPGIGYRRPAFKIRIAELIQKFKKKFRKKAA